jgi:hydroxypyruvate reductase
MDPGRLLTRSLRAHPRGDVVARVLARALAAVEPGEAVARAMRCEGSTLHVDGIVYELGAYDRVLIVAVGKAAVPMAQAAAAILRERLTAGVVVTKEGHLEAESAERRAQSAEPRGQGEEGTSANVLRSALSVLRFFESGHPLPDERGVEAARRVAQLLEGAGERDLVLALISGGGSALLPLPVQGVTLGEIQALTGLLLASGATINELNALRKHLEQLKGGGMARAAAPATVATLVLSDVVGNPLDVIASGPTVPDNTTFADAFAVLERYGLVDQAPPSIVAHLRAGVSGQAAETPKPGERAFERVQHVMVGSNLLAAEAALDEARAHGLNTLLLSTYVQGEAREVGRVLAAIAREIDASGQPLARPACLVAGGETTVTLRGSGRGGRNQELALAAVPELAGLRDAMLVALATDGGDGPTDAAGAVATGATHAEALAAGLSPERALAQNDAYPFFAALDDLLLPGPTATNVNDLAFIFVW